MKYLLGVTPHADYEDVPEKVLEYLHRGTRMNGRAHEAMDTLHSGKCRDSGKITPVLRNTWLLSTQLSQESVVG